MILRSNILFFFCLSLAAANDTQKARINNEMQEITQKIKAQEKLKQQQEKALKEKERQIQCNWRLIRSYEICTKLYSQAPQEQLACIQKSKSNTARCLTNQQP